MNVITVNGTQHEVEQPRLRWRDIGILARIPRITNNMLVSYTLPGKDKTVKEHVYSNSLIVVNGMSLTVRA